MTIAASAFSQPYAERFTEDKFIHPKHKPRIKKNYDKVGFYQIAVSLNKSTLNPGDSFKAEVFFTGYGTVGMSKVAIYPSKADIFDSTSSLLHSFGQLGKQYIWGDKSMRFDKQPYIINLSGGVQFIDTIRTDFYIDGQVNYIEKAARFMIVMLMLS